MSPRSRVAALSTLLLILCFGQAHSQVRLDAEEAEKLVIEKTEPAYPPIARAARAEGVVKVEATVSEQGAVVSARAVSGHPLLQTAAVNAVRKRRYQAYTVGGKQTPFVTEVYVRFPPGELTGEDKRKHERDTELARRYYEEDDHCRELVRGERWKEAEARCQVIVGIADQFSDDRALERMGAYEMFGHVLRGQKRYREALSYYDRALDAVRSRLTEKNAELGRLYGDMAITHHLLRDLDRAREFYRKAEKIFQTAHASIGGDDEDEETDVIKRSYMRSLKKLLEFHLLAAEDAGATSEAEEVRALLKRLP